MTYIIKFSDQTHLTKPEPELYGNFLSDEHYSQFDRSLAQKFSSKLYAIIVAKIVGGKVVTLETKERFEQGKTYLTIGGDEFFVEGVTRECVRNEKGSHRYSRSSYSIDNGRTTGSKWTRDCLRYPPEEVL